MYIILFQWSAQKEMAQQLSENLYHLQMLCTYVQVLLTTSFCGALLKPKLSRGILLNIMQRMVCFFGVFVCDTRMAMSTLGAPATKD